MTHNISPLFLLQYAASHTTELASTLSFEGATGKSGMFSIPIYGQPERPRFARSGASDLIGGGDSTGGGDSASTLLSITLSFIRI
jgi:hypothetical protein